MTVFSANTLRLILICLLWCAIFPFQSFAQLIKDKGGKDSDTPLHRLQPEYSTPYGTTTTEDIKSVLLKIHSYLDSTTPLRMISKSTGKEVKDYRKPDVDAIFEPGDYRLISYEWGVTYAAMLLAGQVTGDARYSRYTHERLKFISETTNTYKSLQKSHPMSPVHSVLEPQALDDAGAMCAAMIKASSNGTKANLRPLIENYINYISKNEYRLQDGTLARNRPLPNTLWLDDLFMSVPALAQMGKLTGETKYFNDAVKQVLQFSHRMFNKEKGLFMHGWVEGMEPHPQFHWGRANGWAIMAIVELLDVLPENHPGRAEIMDLYKSHVKGLASYQSGTGFWHQLLDRNDSYLETSCTAIFTYSITRGINKGWLDRLAYGPMVLLAWNAVSTKVNDKGQVEGTCVGTGMAFDPAFYYHRPVNKYAAHSYGPVTLAGAEMIQFLNKSRYEINDSAVQFITNK
jgi:unsaturated rhamnogalacturonyl hydrolase